MGIKAINLTLAGAIVHAEIHGAGSHRTKYIRISQYIIAELGRLNGMWIRAMPGNIPYFLDGSTRLLHDLSGRATLSMETILAQLFNLNATEGVTQHVLTHLRQHCLATGHIREVRRFAAFDKDTQTSYLNNHDGTLTRFNGTLVERVANGTRYFFLNDDGGSVCPGVVTQSTGAFLKVLADVNFSEETGSGMTPDDQRKLFTIWVFALAFPDIMPTKPILIVEGAQGSGKTTMLNMFQTILQGQSQALIIERNREDDFGIQLLRVPLAVLDNVDSYIDWLPDKVCAYATNGTWKRRALYSNTDEIVLRPQAFLAVASKNPASFRREDTADRSLYIRLKRRDHFKPISEIENDLKARRAVLLGDYYFYINRIVAALRKGLASQGGAHRMADFAGFGYAVEHAMGWPAGTTTRIMQLQRDERDCFLCETDALVDLLVEWVKVTSGRWVTAFDLFHQLKARAEHADVPFYKTPHMLAQKLLGPHLEQFFTMETRITGAHKEYRITPLDVGGKAVRTHGGGLPASRPGVAAKPRLIQRGLPKAVAPMPKASWVIDADE